MKHGFSPTTPKRDKRGTLLFNSQFGTARTVTAPDGQTRYTADQRVLQKVTQRQRARQAQANAELQARTDRLKP